MARGNKLVAAADFWPLLSVIALLLFGLVMVYDASSAQALQSFADKYHFLKDQVKWLLLGTVASTVAFFIDYRLLKKLALPALVGSILLLIAVFIPGLGVKAYGAHRWINLGFTVLQPSEVAKFSLIIYLATWLTSKEKGRLISFIVLMSIFLGLIILEPDMGTAIIVLVTSLSIYFVAGGEVLGLLGIVPLVIAGIIGLAITSPYRLRRLTTFFNPDADPLGASYHIRQALIAIGSGGILGIGLGNSRQKYSYLPESMTDSIFAIIAEEVGLIGVTALIGLFLFFFYRSFRAVLTVEDPFGKLLGLGILFWLMAQTLVNLASMTALIPLTGVPLPFISYGGSALVMEMIGVGFLFNIIYKR